MYNERKLANKSIERSERKIKIEIMDIHILQEVFGALTVFKFEQIARIGIAIISGDTYFITERCSLCEK